MVAIKVINANGLVEVKEDAVKAIKFLKRLGGENKGNNTGKIFGSVVYYINELNIICCKNLNDYLQNMEAGVPHFLEYYTLMEPDPLYLDQVEGYYVGVDSSIYKQDLTRFSHENRNVFKEREQALSALAFAQITQLMGLYEKPLTKKELEDENLLKFNIVNDNGAIDVCDTYTMRAFIMFRERCNAEKFLNDHYELCLQYFMIGV